MCYSWGEILQFLKKVILVILVLEKYAKLNLNLEKIVFKVASKIIHKVQNWQKHDLFHFNSSALERGGREPPSDRTKQNKAERVVQNGGRKSTQ